MQHQYSILLAFLMTAVPLLHTLRTLKNSSSLVTPRAKSSCLVTHPEKAVVATVVRGHKEGTPAMSLIVALFSESLDFKGFYVLLVLDP